MERNHRKATHIVDFEERGLSHGVRTLLVPNFYA